MVSNANQEKMELKASDIQNGFFNPFVFREIYNASYRKIRRNKNDIICNLSVNINNVNRDNRSRN